MQIVGGAGIFPKGIDQEILDDVVALHHGKGSVKKLRQDDEIHCNVVFSGRQDLLLGMAVQKEQIPLL